MILAKATSLARIGAKSYRVRHKVPQEAPQAFASSILSLSGMRL
jgi:hypothetical protein